MFIIFKRNHENWEGIITEPDIPQHVFCIWTDLSIPISENRRKCLETIKNTGLNVIFVTPENLNKYIIPEYPLHKGYQYLSAVHKSDYLRTYLMHFHGGGYTDIKNTQYSWLKVWKKINSDKNIYITGYAERDLRHIACSKNNGELCNILKDNFNILLGNCSYICRKQSIFTTDWYNTLIKTMDEYYEQLVKYPALTPRQIPENDYAYPIEWSGILGNIYHPLCYKYRKHLFYDIPYIDTSNYL